MTKWSVALGVVLGSCTGALSYPPEIAENTHDRCHNRRDDDIDDAIDCADPSCAEFCVENSPEACVDGDDNDEDGLTDGQDVQCWRHLEPRVTRCSPSFGDEIVETGGPGFEDRWVDVERRADLRDWTGPFAEGTMTSDGPVIHLQPGTVIESRRRVGSGESMYRLSFQFYLRPHGRLVVSLRSPSNTFSGIRLALERGDGNTYAVLIDESTTPLTRSLDATLDGWGRVDWSRRGVLGGGLLIELPGAPPWQRGRSSNTPIGGDLSLRIEGESAFIDDIHVTSPEANPCAGAGPLSTCHEARDLEPLGYAVSDTGQRCALFRTRDARLAMWPGEPADDDGIPRWDDSPVIVEPLGIGSVTGGSVAWDGETGRFRLALAGESPGGPVLRLAETTDCRGLDAMRPFCRSPAAPCTSAEVAGLGGPLVGPVVLSNPSYVIREASRLSDGVRRHEVYFAFESTFGFADIIRATSPDGTLFELSHEIVGRVALSAEALRVLAAGDRDVLVLGQELGSGAPAAVAFAIPDDVPVGLCDGLRDGVRCNDGRTCTAFDDEGDKCMTGVCSGPLRAGHPNCAVDALAWAAGRLEEDTFLSMPRLPTTYDGEGVVAAVAALTPSRIVDGHTVDGHWSVLYSGQLDGVTRVAEACVSIGPGGRSPPGCTRNALTAPLSGGDGRCWNDVDEISDEYVGESCRTNPDDCGSCEGEPYLEREGTMDDPVEWTGSPDIRPVGRTGVMLAEPSETARVEVADLPPLPQDVDLDVFVDVRVVDADEACVVGVGLDSETAVTIELVATSETGAVNAQLGSRSAGGLAGRSASAISLVRDRWYRLALRLRGPLATLSATSRIGCPIASPEPVTLEVPEPRADRVAVVGEPGLRPGACRVVLDNLIVVQP